MSTTRVTANALGRLPGPVSVELAYRMFGHVGRAAAVHSRDAAVHRAASASTLRVAGKQVMTYAWGTGPEVVLLVHGWHSRASTLSTLISTLERPSRTILAFDAPANGASRGSKVTALDYAHVIAVLAEHYGPFEAIVAHSFGALASFLAINNGVRTARIVSIAGVHSGDRLVDAFASQIGLAPHRVPRLKRRLAAGPFRPISDPWTTLVSELDSDASDTPLLVVCDEGDRVVDPIESARIAGAHRGRLVTLTTRGLGHSRILGDPTVLTTVADFVDNGALTERSLP